MALSDIDTFIVLILENRSFDHMLGYLSLSVTPSPLGVDGLRSDPAWLGPHANMFSGKPFPIHRLAPKVQVIADPPHDKQAIATQITTPPAAGAPQQMGGFVKSYVELGKPTNRSLVMGYYDQQAVPVFDFLARNFAVCDHWFSSLPAGTQPNRLMAMSGTSNIATNAEVFLPDQRLVYDWLSDHKVSWCAYQSGDFFPFFSLMPRWLPEIVTSLSLSAFGGRGHFRRYARFAEHWAANELMPSVIFIEPEYSDGPHDDPNDDHPPTGIAKGQLFVADIYESLVRNPGRWQKTMMIITYDEHGGFFDHCNPLPIPTMVGGVPFTTTGVRVPALVISPQVSAGTVHAGDLDHTSLLQLLADRFNANQDYSAAVGVRQPHLTRLANVIQPALLPVRSPAIPDSVIAGLKAQDTGASILAATGAEQTDPPNAQALHYVALKVANDYPELLKGPGWKPLNDYLAVVDSRSDKTLFA